ncbi:MAG: hypothetical protein HY361_00850 [Candidatus Aenigmarchaeota archaeon]|nr:hypothetical protein [Candidatus Aenigmarchaeota archaeon]
MIEVVKRRGHKEKFDERKLYGSVYAACKVANMGERGCEGVASHVTKKVKDDLRKKKIVNSSNIANLAKKHLRMKNKDAAFIYETHRDIS